MSSLLLGNKCVAYCANIIRLTENSGRKEFPPSISFDERSTVASLVKEFVFLISNKSRSKFYLLFYFVRRKWRQIWHVMYVYLYKFGVQKKPLRIQSYEKCMLPPFLPIFGWQQSVVKNICHERLNPARQNPTEKKTAIFPSHPPYRTQSH